MPTDLGAASEDPLIIEGDIPLNELNKNGWGIPDRDVKNAISSLKHAVVRICNRGSGDAHSCDDTGDPYAEIGRVIDAKREGDAIRTKVAITDRDAKQKIEDGTWENKWSPFGHTKKLENGWTEGLNIESLTLVRNPAWDTASYAISASESGIVMSMPTITFKGTLISPYGNGDIAKGGLEKGKGNMTEKEEKSFSQGDVDKAVKAAIDKAKPETDKAIKAAVDKVTKAEQDKAKAETDKAVKAALAKKELVTKEDADKMVAAALEKEKKEIPYTKAEIGKMVKAAEENAEKRTREGLEKEAVIASIMDVLTRTEVLKAEDKADRLKSLSGMALDTLKAQYEVIAQFGEKLNVKAAEIKDLTFPVDAGADAEKVIGWTEVKK